MACVPHKNSAVRERCLESGEVRLSYPAAVRPWAATLSRLFRGEAPPQRRRQLQLDSLGSAVWRLLDGRRSVAQVVAAFREQYQLHPKEAELSVTRFLKTLGERGLVFMKIDDPAGDQGR